MNYSMLSHFQWIRLDANILETMPRKTGGKKDRFGTCRHGLTLERVFVLWKTSCVVPVPKSVHPKEPGHFHPVALTSHLMKTMESIILRHIRQVSMTLAYFQFAYHLRHPPTAQNTYKPGEH